MATGKQIAGSQYVTDPNNRAASRTSSRMRFFAHYRREGVFRHARLPLWTRLCPQEHRRKRLAIMDQDGANLRYMTRGDDLVMTPRFSPSSQDVTYMSFGDVRSQVILLNIEIGQREVVGNFPGMTFSPRFSPDGQRS